MKILRLTPIFGLLLWITLPALANTRWQAATSVALRLHPSADAPIIGQAKKGDSIVGRREEGEWIAIAPPAQLSLWINKDFIEGQQIVAKSAPIRSGPGIQHPVVDSLNRGATVVVQSEDGDWARIAPPDQLTLWVPKKDLVAAPAAPSVASTEVAAAAPRPAPPAVPPVAAEPAKPKASAPKAPAAPSTPPASPPTPAKVAPRPPPAPLPPPPAPPPVASTPGVVTPSVPETTAKPPPVTVAYHPRFAPSTPLASSSPPPVPPSGAPSPTPRPPTLQPTVPVPKVAPSSPSPDLRQPSPAPAIAAPAVSSTGEEDIQANPALVEDLDLAADVPNQGRPVRVEGELRNAPFMTASPSRYRLQTKNDQNVLEMICHIHGDSRVLRQYVGKRVAIRGWEYWVEKSDMPVVVVGQILLVTSAGSEPVLF